MSASDAAREQPRGRDAYAEFQEIPTRWMDNDVYGHVNNVIHYSLFDTAVNGWLIRNGLLDIEKSDAIGLVVETGCSYFAEIRFPDVVTAGLRVAKLGNSSVRFEIGLFRNDAGTPAAEGYFVHVYVDRRDRRPVRIDDRRRDAFRQLAMN